MRKKWWGRIYTWKEWHDYILPIADSETVRCNFECGLFYVMPIPFAHALDIWRSVCYIRWKVYIYLIRKGILVGPEGRHLSEFKLRGWDNIPKFE